jgi:hypothetical protein
LKKILYQNVEIRKLPPELTLPAEGANHAALNQKQCVRRFDTGSYVNAENDQ